MALAATALSEIPPTTESFYPLRWVYPANGETRLTSAFYAGDGAGNGGAHHLDWSAPLLFEAGGRRRVFAFNLTGVFNFDQVYSVPLSPESAPLLEAFLDPDGDGIHRGFIDARTPDGRPRFGYVDADGDGLSEYREVAGEPGPDCIATVPPRAGRCWRAKRQLRSTRGRAVDLRLPQPGPAGPGRRRGGRRV